MNSSACDAAPDDVERRRRFIEAALARTGDLQAAVRQAVTAEIFIAKGIEAMRGAMEQLAELPAPKASQLAEAAASAAAPDVIVAADADRQPRWTRSEMRQLKPWGKLDASARAALADQLGRTVASCGAKARALGFLGRPRKERAAAAAAATGPRRPAKAPPASTPPSSARWVTPAPAPAEAKGDAADAPAEAPAARGGNRPRHLFGWTPAQEDDLRRGWQYSAISPAAIGAKIGRTASACKQRAFALNLARSSKIPPADICDYFGVPRDPRDPGKTAAPLPPLPAVNPLEMTAKFSDVVAWLRDAGHKPHHTGNGVWTLNGEAERFTKRMLWRRANDLRARDAPPLPQFVLPEEFNA